MKKQLYFIFLLISLVFSSYSQTIASSYAFTNPATVAYAAIAGTTVHAAGVDDAISASVPIGFPFNYGCTAVSNMKISSNGWLTFNTALSTWYATNDLDNATNGITNPLIVAPLWDDNQVFTGGAVRYQLTGTAPNQIMKIEWFRMEWDWFASGDVMSYQVWLYETTNVIEFRYKRGGTNVSAGGASIGLMGATTGDFISINNTPAASTVAETNNITVKPVDNGIYRFTPIACSGAPASGTAVATPSTNCSNFNTTLTLTGASTACGVTYQWYHSNTAGGTYTAIGTPTTVTSQTFAITSATPKFFYCVTTCGAFTSSTSVISASVSATPPGTGNYAVSLPYSIAAQTTCGMVNDITSTNVTNVCGSTNYYTGEDVLYAFTPTVTAAFNASVTSSGSWVGVMLYQGCPTGTGVCVANSQSSSGNQSITGCATTVTAGVTYYLLIDSYASPTCNPYNLSMSLNTCSGAPASGTAVATPSTNCSNFNTTLTLTGASTSCGVTYQWYHSNTAGGTYTAIGTPTTVTSQTFAITSATPKFFYCVTTCGAFTSSTSVISASVSATPPGTGNYAVSLPYSITGQTTCGMVDDITSGNVTNVCGSTSYYTGEDVLYAFTPTVTAAFNASVTSSGSWVGVMLYQGCPTGTGVCVANSQSSSGNQSITGCATTVTAGVTYYLMIDSYASPTCNPYDLSMTQVGCTSSPTAGVAVATPSSSCSNFTTTLTLTGNSTSCGTTFQWYHSNSAAGTYTVIGTATTITSQTFAITSATPKFFKCVVTCGASSATTAVISASVNSSSAGIGSYSVSIPYSTTGQTTCGFINDITSSNVGNICGSSSYYTGEDVVYVFTPTVTGIFDASVTSSGSYVGMMLYQGCPTGTGVCVANAQSSAGNQSLGGCGSSTVSVTSGLTYFLIIDSYASPTCNPYSLTMSMATSTFVCNMAYTPSSTTYSFETLSAPTILPTTDDVLFADYIDFGFPICYDGTPYTGGYVASNSSFVFDAVPCFPNIQSTTYAAGGVSTGYTISGAAPINGTSVPRNAILAPWHDINPGSSAVVASSKIQYQITGTAPNRKVVISWEDIPMFSGACETIAASRASSQVKIYEFDSSIEIHIKNKQLCTTWNGGDAILGLQNYNGTQYVPPVNATAHNYPTDWTMTNTAYKFTSSCNNSPACLLLLPIGFKNFYGDNIDNVNTLFWQTATEENMDYFVVERSTDAINFTDIGKVFAKNNPSSYTYKDYESVPGMINYYRIRSVEKNLKTTETNIISIGAGENEILSTWPIYPNPANTNEVFARLNSKKTGTANFIIYDILGNIVIDSEKTIEPGVKVYDIDISKLSLGIYYVEVKNSFSETITKQKLIINK